MALLSVIQALPSEGETVIIATVAPVIVAAIGGAIGTAIYRKLARKG